MRIPIREQLGALVLFSTLVGLAVVAIATWITNHSFVSRISSLRLTNTASIKAEELASDFNLYQTVAKTLSTRVKLQDALRTYNSPSSTRPDWAAVTSDLQDALRSNDITYSTAIFGRAEDNNVLINVTDPTLDLPLMPSLTPNLTYTPEPGQNGSAGGVMSFDGKPLYAESAFFLGPTLLNATFAVGSILLPILNNTAPSVILGWVSVGITCNLPFQILESKAGLYNTGTILIIGPDDVSNRFPSDTSPTPQAIENVTDVEDTLVHFAFPPLESLYEDKRHAERAFGTPNAPFNITSYPAALTAFTQEQNKANNAGVFLSTKNENGDTVSVGFARPSTSLVEWVLLVEQSHDEVWAPIRNLRNILLACVFGTAGAMVLFIYPVAHLFSRPIQRLREATNRSVHPEEYDNIPGTPTRGRSESAAALREEANGFTSDQLSSPVYDEKAAEANGVASSIAFSGSGKGRSRFRWMRRKTTGTTDEEDQDESFQIPGKVKESRHIIHDELTDLTTTFNAMSDELVHQYSKLEARVKSRTAELELSKKAAEAANESKTLFIANLSHELKTPLNAILGLCAVSMQDEDPERIKKSLQQIYTSGDLLHNLLTDLLTFSKNQVGRHLTLDEKEFNLHDIGTQLKAIFNNQAKEGKIRFKVLYEGPCDALGARLKPGVYDALSPDEQERYVKSFEYAPKSLGRVKNMTLWGDQHRILQVAINLISNSLKFTAATGSVTCTVRCLDHVPTGGSRRSSVQSSPKSIAASGRQSPSLSSSMRMATATEINPLDRSSRRSRSAMSDSARSPSPPTQSQQLWFHFEVVDTGPGIPVHLQSQIFEPFVQGDLRLTKKFGGTGLGLSICSQLARLLGGTIELESEVGVGSKFTLAIPLRHVTTRSDKDSVYTVSRVNSIAGHEEEIVLPNGDVNGESPEEIGATAAKGFDTADSKLRLVGLSQPYFSQAQPPMASPNDNNDRSENKYRVLVAEDNKLNQEVVLRMLRLEDVFDVQIAKDGQEALDMVKQSMQAGKPYHLIFMDVQMPNLDGRQSTRLIRETGYTAPIVALTAFADEVNQKECMDSGMDYFLAKPIRRPALKHVLKTYCPTIEEQEEEGVSPTTGRGPLEEEMPPGESTLAHRMSQGEVGGDEGVEQAVNGDGQKQGMNGEVKS